MESFWPRLVSSYVHVKLPKNCTVILKIVGVSILGKKSFVKKNLGEIDRWRERERASLHALNGPVLIYF